MYLFFMHAWVAVIIYFLFPGQFFRKGVEIDEVHKILIMPNKNPVPVKRRPVWSFMEREKVTSDDQLCWTAKNRSYQGKGLIDGTYLDYLVDDVLSTDFQFDKQRWFFITEHLN